MKRGKHGEFKLEGIGWGESRRSEVSRSVFREFDGESLNQLL